MVLTIVIVIVIIDNTRTVVVVSERWIVVVRTWCVVVNGRDLKKMLSVVITKHFSNHVTTTRTSQPCSATTW